MCDDLGLDKYNNVELLHDPKRKKIALRFNNHELGGGNIAMRRNRNNFFINAKSFVKVATDQYGYPVSTDLPYTVEDDIVILHKGVQDEPISK
jgi:hypothetical protein